MSPKQRTHTHIIQLQLRLFSRKYPALLYVIKWLFISLIIGITAGTASAGFLESLSWATRFRESHAWLIAFLPLAGLAVGMLHYYFGKDVEAGNNLLIETIHEPAKKIIPFKMAPFVYIGTIATHFFGGSAGREGTALQMAGAISDQFTKLLKLNEQDRKVLIISAIAAGFGSVFGTPLAGAVFGLEVFLIGKIRYNGIFPAFASAILADQVTRLWHVHHTEYLIGVIPKNDFLPFIYSVIAGIVFGICAAAFSRLMHYGGFIFKSKFAYPPLRSFVGGIIIAAAVFAMGTTRYIGLGIPVIEEAFGEQLPLYDFVLKMLFTVVTLSAGFKGGEVTPLFFIGATLGSALSIFIPLPYGLLAGMGFVAVFAGATNTPLACTLMGIELFGAECGIYVAIACIVAYLFSGNNSIYTKQKIGEAKNSRFRYFNNKNFEDL
ncbi:voltage-gated chloride channel family protein [Chryseobacterium sp. PET-29]|uniref:voltage-gated chloride channel family protein n=1 Tax=Chryseobacterium sp. PET-29 TaxID=2983267 RepID=UPI0021E596CE|nr:voltage-gated chloride channel family protein [Chryseobacterium sp. PET-29]